MIQSAQLRNDDGYDNPAMPRSRHLSAVKFFTRYPLFLLFFGPPLFRPVTGIDATRGQIDIWSLFQVGLLCLVAFRAIIRLTSAQFIVIPRQIRSILRLSFFLGLLFLISVAYSPSRVLSAAYSVFYFLALICLVEFIADVYRTPPNWMQCLFQIRFGALLLLVLVLLTLAVDAPLVLTVIGEAGIRLTGGAVAPIYLICPTVAIISAYTFLYSLESRVRSGLLFLVGIAGTLVTQSRGPEIALFISLLLTVAGWASTSRRARYMFISGFIASITFGCVIVGATGGERIWNVFNRGQSTEGIATASGRTEIWTFVIHYCMSHPQGMGYVTGFRILFRKYFILGLDLTVTHIGNTHNTFLQFLADAGWLALAIYLILLVKVFVLGFRFTEKRLSTPSAQGSASLHALRCALMLLVLCLAEGMDVSDFAVPLRVPFYFQNIIVAIILGVSANMLSVARIRHVRFDQ